GGLPDRGQRAGRQRAGRVRAVALGRRERAVTRFEVEVPAAAAGARYPIFIGSRALTALPEMLRRARASRIQVVSDSRVWKRWGGRLAAVLRASGVPFARTVVPAGERSKSAAALERVWREAARAGCDRRSVVLA